MRTATGGKRRDGNEKPIVLALRGLGCLVWHVSGAGLPDLLVKAPGPSGRWIPLEVKTAKGKATPLQAGIPWAIVRTPDEAVDAVFG